MLMYLYMYIYAGCKIRYKASMQECAFDIVLSRTSVVFPEIVKDIIWLFNVEHLSIYYIIFA